MRDYRDNEKFYDYAFRPEFMRLEFLEIHLLNMSRLFEEDHARVVETHRDLLAHKEEALLRYRERGEDGYEFNSSQIETHYEIEELTMNSISIELFYPSFFISLYADFEKSLLKLCDELRSPNERITIQDLQGKGIERSKLYLVKVLNVDNNFFGKNQNWSEICTYGKLRNNLAHNDDTTSPSLSKEYCFNAINVIGDFWISLFSELSQNFEIQ